AYYKAALPFLSDSMKTIAYLDLAKYYFDHQISLSQKYLQKADSITLPYNNTDAQFEILILNAKLSAENKEYDKAKTYLKQAESLNYQDAEPLAETYVFLGNKLLKDEIFSEAIKSFSPVVNHMQVSYFLKSKAASGLATAYNKSGEKEKENQMLRTYVALMDSTLEESLREERNRINSPLNQQNLERKIDLYQKESKIQNLIIEKEKTKKTHFIILVLILAPLLFFIFLLYRDRSSANKKLREQNLQINQQVDELSEMVQCLSLSKQQLQNANNTKEKLFSIVAHDLKSPLISLKTLLYSLNSQTLNPPNPYQQQLREIENNLNTIMDLLNNLLFWAITQKESISMQPREFNLGKTAETDIILAQNIAKQKNILMKNEIPPALKIVTDKNMYLFILRNLLSNALKYTPPHGEISVSIKENKNIITLMVKDTGPGMDKEKQKTIFDWVKPDKEEKNHDDGTRLGMPLSQEFAAKMGGTLTVTSSPGQGSLFMLSIPVNLT
ncbi:MAG: sensor histidine kinase, partial [Bacteroidota bacterium]